MIGVARGGWRAALAASLVFALTVGLTVALTYLVFRPLITPLADASTATEPGERLEKIEMVEGKIDSLDRPKYWGQGPVTGPAFTPRDPTTVVDIDEVEERPKGETFTPTVTEPGFGFRLPAGWSCYELHNSGTPYVGWFCAEAGTPGGVLSVATQPVIGPGATRGYVILSPCRKPCDPEAKKLDPRHTYSTTDAEGQPLDTLTRREYSGRIRESDPTTAYVEQTVERDGGSRYLLSTDHLWRRGEGRSDVRVVVTFSGPSGEEAEIQKIVNDVRGAT